MSEEALKLTVYFGERDRADDTLLAGALLDVFERHRLQVSVLLRGAEGFGLKQRLRVQRVLTLSEDLPLVAVAVDARERIEAALPDVLARVGDGLVTLERARLLAGGLADALAPDGPGEGKLTLYVGRHERAAGRPAAPAAVDVLRRHGAAGATVLLGVDGTVRGRRHRARLVAANRGVPALVLSVGPTAALAAALDELGTLLDEPVATLERVTVLRRDGAALAAPPALPADAGLWTKLTVLAGEQARHAGRPLAPSLLRALRGTGAAGATTLRGVWGFHGDHAPHGDRLLALRRRVPVMCIAIDTPRRAAAHLELVSELTAQSGLVTAEIVPALRAVAGEATEGALRLAARVPDRPEG